MFGWMTVQSSELFGVLLDDCVQSSVPRVQSCLMFGWMTVCRVQSRGFTAVPGAQHGATRG